MDPFAIIQALGLHWGATVFLVVWAAAALYLLWLASGDRGLSRSERVHLRNLAHRARKPYLWLTRQIEDGVPDALLPPLVADDPPPSGRMVRFLWATEPHIRDEAQRVKLKANPWSWPVMDFAMRIAIAYPLLFASTQWALFSAGAATEIAGLTLFTADVAPPLRTALIGLIAIMVISLIVASATSRALVKTRAMWLFWIAVAGAFAAAFAATFAAPFAAAFAFAFAAAVAGAVAFAAAGPFAGSFAFAAPYVFAATFAGPFVGPFAGAVAGAFAFAGAVALAAAVYFSALRGHAAMGFSGLILFTIISAMAALSSTDIGLETLGMIFAFVFLPAVNVTFDWLSYGTTIWLLRKGRNRQGIWPTLCGCADIVAALLIFFLLSLSLLIGLATVNALRGQDLIDLGLLLGQLRHDPGQHLWIVAMIASTLLPTLVHLAIGLFGLTVALPLQRVQNWIEMLNHPDNRISHTGGAIKLGGFVALCVVVPPLALYLIGWTIWHYGESLRNSYIDALVGIAHWVGFL